GSAHYGLERLEVRETVVLAANAGGLAVGGALGDLLLAVGIVGFAVGFVESRGELRGRAWPLVARLAQRELDHPVDRRRDRGVALRDRRWLLEEMCAD